jgi:hypothetical protein
MRKFSFLFLGLSFIILQVATAQNCNCRQVSKGIIEKIEKNYVIKDSLKFNSKFQAIKRLVYGDKVIARNKCGAFLQNLAESLNDKHIRIMQHNGTDTAYRPPKFEGDIDEPGAPWAYAGSMWQTMIGGDVTYRLIGDKSEKRRYWLVVTESNNPRWRVGDIKAWVYDYKGQMYAEYIMNNYNKNNVKISISKNLIDVGGLFYFYRKGGAMARENKPVSVFQTDSASYSYIKIADAVSNLADSILKQNRDIISKTPHWVIDVRDNMGGSVRSFSSLTPYLYTNPIRIESGYYLASEENISQMEESVKWLRSQKAGSEKGYERFVNILRQNMGKLVLDSGSYYRQDSIYQYPSKISIIMNNKSASATELFLIRALQSKKVKLFGQNTYGAGDKLDAYDFNVGYCNYHVSIPVSLRIRESYKKEIDMIGIPPNKYIPNGCTDVLKFVLNNNGVNR